MNLIKVYIVQTGCIYSGMHFHGPFYDSYKAQDYCERYFSLLDYHIVELENRDADG